MIGFFGNDTSYWDRLAEQERAAVEREKDIERKKASKIEQPEERKSQKSVPLINIPEQSNSTIPEVRKDEPASTSNSSPPSRPVSPFARSISFELGSASGTGRPRSKRHSRKFGSSSKPVELLLSSKNASLDMSHDPQESLYLPPLPALGEESAVASRRQAATTKWEKQQAEQIASLIHKVTEKACALADAATSLDRARQDVVREREKRRAAEQELQDLHNELRIQTGGWSMDELIADHKHQMAVHELKEKKRELEKSQAAEAAQQARIEELEEQVRKLSAQVQRLRRSSSTATSLATRSVMRHARSPSAASNRLDSAHSRQSSRESLMPASTESLFALPRTPRNSTVDPSLLPRVKLQANFPKTPFPTSVSPIEDGCSVLRDLTIRTILMRCRLALCTGKIKHASRLATEAVIASRGTDNDELTNRCYHWQGETMKKLRQIEITKRRAENANKSRSLIQEEPELESLEDEEREELLDAEDAATIDIVLQRDTPPSQWGRARSQSDRMQHPGSKKRPPHLVGLGLSGLEEPSPATSLRLSAKMQPQRPKTPQYREAVDFSFPPKHASAYRTPPSDDTPLEGPQRPAFTSTPPTHHVPHISETSQDSYLSTSPPPDDLPEDLPQDLPQRLPVPQPEQYLDPQSARIITDWSLKVPVGFEGAVDLERPPTSKKTCMPGFGKYTFDVAKMAYERPASAGNRDRVGTPRAKSL